MSKVVFRGDLRGLLQIRGMSQVEFAYAAGLSLATIHKAVRGEEISHITFAKIIRALGAIAPVGELGGASGSSGVTHSAAAGPRRPAQA